MSLDVRKVVAQVNLSLNLRGFLARDTDGTDLQRGTDTTLRFKTGTSYGEVAITVWHNSQRVDTIRIFTEEGVKDAMRLVDVWIARNNEKAAAANLDPDYAWTNQPHTHGGTDAPECTTCEPRR